MAQTIEKEQAGKQPATTGRRMTTRRLEPLQDLERWLETIPTRGWLSPLRWEWPTLGGAAQALEQRVPHVDVIDRDSEVLVRAEVPGIGKKDLEVSVADDTVTIRGMSRREEKEEKGDYYRCEISRGAFARTVTLPAEVQADSAKATFKDGVLELVLPKAKASRRRTIPID